MTVTEPREGSSADLVRRMERLEERLDRLEPAVAEVATNQKHAEELNALRFANVQSSVNLVSSDLKEFMRRIEGIIAGDVETGAARQAREMVADWQKWRDKTDAKFETIDQRQDDSETFHTQISTVARVALVILGSGWIATAFALWRVLNP